MLIHALISFDFCFEFLDLGDFLFCFCFLTNYSFIVVFMNSNKPSDHHPESIRWHVRPSLQRKAHPDSFWPLGRGDVSGQVRILHRRRLLHCVRLQRCNPSSVVLEWKTPHHRGQPQQQWVVTTWKRVNAHTVRVVCGNSVLSSRWLSRSQGSTDRAWPRGGVCVCVCRTGAGD